MIVRRATAADAERLALVGAASFLESFADDHPGDGIVEFCATHHSRAAWDKALVDPDQAAWIVEGPVGAPIGYALLVPPVLPGTMPADAELKRIYVLSRWHGAGLGRTLYQQVEDEARRRGAARLVLGVYKKNDKAIRFYMARGFEAIGETVFADFDVAFGDYVMAKPLKPLA